MKLSFVALISACLIGSASSGTIKLCVDFGNKPVEGAKVSCYDKDIIGKDPMGNSATLADGCAFVTFPVKKEGDKLWDLIDNKPDVICEVEQEGFVKATTKEVENVNADNSSLVIDLGSLTLLNITATGTLKMCVDYVGIDGKNRPVNGADVKCYDKDIIGKELMGSASTPLGGCVDVPLRLRKGEKGETWDGENDQPDVFCDIEEEGFIKHTTTVINDVNASNLDLVVDLGTITIANKPGMSPTFAPSTSPSQFPSNMPSVSAMPTGSRSPTGSPTRAPTGCPGKRSMFGAPGCSSK